MTATDLDLDALLDALLERAVARAEARPLINVAGQEVGAPGVQAGRLQVNPGDTIQSAWGNATYDQSVQQYATVADRTAQWPTPADGALSYTVDQALLWLRRQGAWTALSPVAASAPAGAVTISGLTPIPLGSPTYDTLAGFSTAAYTVRMAGFYLAMMRLTIASVPASNGPAMRIQRNTVDLLTLNLFNGASVASTLTGSAAEVVQLAVGDSIRMACGNTGGTVTAGPATSALTLIRIGGI